MHSPASTRISITKAIKRMRDTWMPSGSAVMLVGPPGSGKSSIPLHWITTKWQPGNWDFGCGFMNAASAESIDIRGLPLMTGTMLAGEGPSAQVLMDPRTHYGMPQWLQASPAKGLRGAYPAFCPANLREASKAKGGCPEHLQKIYSDPAREIMTRQITAYAKGIVIIDEAAQVAGDEVLLPEAQLADEGHVGSWGVPPSWMKLLITNRLEDQAGVRELPAHLKNRLAIVETYIGYDDVVAHWHRIGMREEMVFFAATNPQFVFADKVPADDRQYATARSWDYCAREINNFCKHGLKLPEGEVVPDTADTRCLMASRVGEATTNQFFTYLSTYLSMPTFEEVCAHPDKAKLNEANHLAQISAIEMLAKRLGDMDDGSSSGDSPSGDDPSEGLMGPVCEYVRRTGKVLATRFAERLVDSLEFQALRSQEFQALLSWIGGAAQARLWRV